MSTPCPICGRVISPCTCEEDIVREADTELLVSILTERGFAVTPPAEEEA